MAPPVGSAGGLVQSSTLSLGEVVSAAQTTTNLTLSELLADAADRLAESAAGKLVGEMCLSPDGPTTPHSSRTAARAKLPCIGAKHGANSVDEMRAHCPRARCWGLHLWQSMLTNGRDLLG